MKKLRCESQADIFGKRDSHQGLAYMMVKWRLPCLENVINTWVWYNNTHISFAINYIALFLQSHPMWVRGLKSHCCYHVTIIGLVAPHVGAWIEMHMHIMMIMYRLCRTPCGCVDWNTESALSHPMWVRRTPCGCVDWNNTNAYKFAPRLETHPMWVRGLK